MKEITLVLLCAFLYSNSIAQNQSYRNDPDTVSVRSVTQDRIDSLKHVLAFEKADTSRVNQMVSLSSIYTNQCIDSAKKYGDDALALSRQIRFPMGEFNAMMSLGGMSREVGDLPKAMHMYLNAIQVVTDNQFNDEAIARCYLSMGNVYYDLTDYQKALYYEYKALSINQSDNTKWGVYQSLSSVYIDLDRMDSASYYANKAYKFVSKSNIGYTLRNLGRIQAKNGNYRPALDYYFQSLSKFIYLENFRNIAYTNNLMATLYQSMNKPDSSIFYANLGLTNAMKGPFKKRIAESYAALMEAYQSKNDYKNAFKYQELLTTTKESLVGAGNVQTIQSMIDQEQERKKELDTKKVAYKNALKQYFLLSGLGIFLIIAFILYRNNRQKQKVNKVLQEQKDKVESTLRELKATQSQLIQSEKMASLGELTAGIAHEIQNPLNFVNNFSEVNTELIDEAGEEMDKGNISEAKIILNDIKANEEKINHHGKRADAIVKGMLQHSRSSNGVKEPTNINALADEYLRLAYHGLRAKDKSFNATMITDYDETIGNINIVPQDIGRVVLNLINNAFYVVNEKSKQNIAGYEPTVTVATKRLSLPSGGPQGGLGGRSIEIKVSDNGGGIPQKIVDKIFQPFFTTKPTGQGTGLGLSLSYDIVKAHGGQLTVETEQGIGTTFIIQLPTQQQ